MGQTLTKSSHQPLKPMLPETQIFATWTLDDVKELAKRFRDQVFGFALVEAQFESIISFKESVAGHIPLEVLFDTLDNDNDGRIDGLELLAGLSICCRGEFDDKAKFCFELFDFNLNATLSKKEMVVMMMAAICGINILTGGGEEQEPDLETFEKLATNAFFRADKDKSGNISCDEFITWARSNRDMMAAVESLTRLAEQAKLDIDTDDSAKSASEGELSDAEFPDAYAAMHAKIPKSHSFNPLGCASGDGQASEDEDFTAVVQWKGQIHEPTNYVRSRLWRDGPDTNLSLEWVHGVRAHNSRGNVRYVVDESKPDVIDRIVYPAARLGVVYNIADRTQQVYQGHSAEVTCLAMHKSGRIVATGDKSAQIHIWDAISMESLGTIQGMVKQGVQHIAFAPDGEEIVTVGMDVDRTITIYETSSGDVISSSRGLASPNNVFGLAYSGSGKEICIVGKATVSFFKNVHSKRRALQSVNAKIGKHGKKQTFFCVAYFNEDPIVGCASGEIYKFVGGRCTHIVQAHGIGDPVLSIFCNEEESILVTGGKDGTVRTWTSELREVGSALDLSEDLDGDGRADNGCLDHAAISVHIIGNKILVGTKGSDIFEAIMPATPTDAMQMNRLAWGHSRGELWGLATHPSKDEFVTTGDDKSLRVWSIRSKEMIHLRVLPCASRSVQYNGRGSLLCVGMEDGQVALVNSSSMRVIESWRHSCKPITDIKFSPNGLFLAAASADGNIYIYKSDDGLHFSRQAVCKGHEPVLHIDFSASGQYVQSNSEDCSLLYWDMSGNQLKAATRLRDISWASWTCTLGWPVQGIFPPHSAITDVNSCHAVPEVSILATGDDFGKVNLFRYPSLDPGAVRQEHMGHAGNVTSVRFTYTRRHLITVGGSDCTIIIWKHELEELESSDEESESHTPKSEVWTSEEEPLECDYKGEIGDVGDRTVLQEAVNRQQSTQELVDLMKDQVIEDFIPVRPWKGHIVEPTRWREKMMEDNPHQTVDGTTDVDLELSWVHGYRSYDCRNNLRYNAAGDIVYHSATLGIVLSKPTGKQRFLQGAHTDDVIGIAAHPAGQIFATGEAGRNPVIIVWNAETMCTLARLRGAHTRGIPLLAFNENGNYLASIGLDAGSSLAVYDWKKGSLEMKTSTSKGRVLCMTFITSPSQGHEIIATGGESHLKFWWWRGQNARSQKCIWNGAKIRVAGRTVLPDILSVASGSRDVVVAGTARGKLLIFSHFRYVGCADNALSPHREHKSPVQCMWCRVGDVDDSRNAPIYITGDKAGNVVVWIMRRHPNQEDMFLENFGQFNASAVSVKLSPGSTSVMTPTNHSIRSLCEREGILLIGTQGGEIYEIPCVLNRKDSDISGLDVHIFPAEGQLLVCGCGKGEVWGLQCHPVHPVFFTSSDDGTIRCWSLETHKLIFLHFLEEEKSRSLALRPNSSHIAVSCNSGKLKIFSYRVDGDKFQDWVELIGNQAPEAPTNRIIEVTAYSFDGSILAVGSHDSNIYLYYVKETDEGIIHTKTHTLHGHAGRLTHLDFGLHLKHGDTIEQRCADAEAALEGDTTKKLIDPSEIVIQSNCSNFELRFWRGDGTEVRSASAERDTTWASFRCTLGWPVQGIWPPQDDGAEVYASCRSNSWKIVPVLATADNYGRVRLFNYPATKPGAPDKCYRGHSRNIRNIGFSFNDSYCISTGGDDHSIFLWSTDIIEEIREREALATEEKAFKLILRPSDSVETNKWHRAKNAMHPVFEDSSVVGSDRYYGEDTEEAMAEGSDEFDGAINVHNSRRRKMFGDESIISKPWKSAIREPSSYIESPRVGEIPQAALELTYVYGYRGWDCRNNIGFADSSDQVVYHVAGVGIVLSTSTNSQIHNTEHSDDILCLDVHPEGHTVVTGEIGKKPKLVLWDANTGVTLRTILFHQRGICNVAFTRNGSHVVSVGMDVDGIVAVHNCRSGVITGSGKIGRGVTINVLAVAGTDTFITGGKMHVKFWDMSNKTGGRVELMSKAGLFGKQAQSKHVISAAYLGTDAVTGMGDGLILLWKGRSNSKAKKAHTGAVTAMTSIAASNSGANTGNSDTGPRILTGGVDGMVYLWNSQLICMWSFNLQEQALVYSPHIQALAYREGKVLIGTKASEILEVGLLSNEINKLVCGHFTERGEVWGLAAHPHRQTFATCGDDMTVRVWDSKMCSLKHIARIKNKARALEYSPDGFQLALGLHDGRVLVLTEDLEITLSESPVASEWIQTMAYAPNGHSLAVGSHDSNIYILETKNYNIRCVCRGHPLSVTQLDFSSCSQIVHSVSKAFDLLFWDANSGEQITSPTSVRDVKWDRWTCSVGWPVQGIWDENSKGSDINSVDVSKDGKLLVTGDDFKRIKLYRYPCVKVGSHFKEYKGHAAHIPSVKFHHKALWVFSVGGFDKAVMQFAVKTSDSR